MFYRKQETRSHNRMPQVLILYLMRGWLHGGNPFTKSYIMLEEERAQERVGGEEGAHSGVRKMEFHSINRSVLHFAIHLDVVVGLFFFCPQSCLSYF